MNLNEMICRRKSVRSDTGRPVDDAALQKIGDFSAKWAIRTPSAFSGRAAYRQ